MPPLALTNEMISTLTMLAQPLRRGQRHAFMETVASRLRREKVIGEGLVSRVGREVQREFLCPSRPGMSSG
jgi:hypothetical protein